MGLLNTKERYDAVFAVMQYQQMWSVLDDLSACTSPLVVLVGNNPSASKIEQYIKNHSQSPKTVLFGFQATGGRREEEKAICVRFGAAGLECGLLHSEPNEATKAKLNQLFAGTKYKPTYFSDMDAWYNCHLAMILPICYVCYRNRCDLKKVTRSQLRQAMAAIREGYGLLSILGYPMLPKGEAACFKNGPKKVLMFVLLWIMAKTDLGRLAVSDHCRSAVTEMQALNDSFDQLKKQAKISTPAWDSLELYLPRKQES